MSVNELFYILISDNPSLYLRSNNFLFNLIPELKESVGFDQKSDWHIYDVFEHIMHVVDGVPSNLVIRTAALFHDVGKPYTFKLDENGIGHFYGHWKVSCDIFNKFASNYNLDEDFTKRVLNLIFYHDYNVEKLGNKIYDVFDRDGIIKLYQLKKADLLAQNSKYHYILGDYEKQKTKLLSIIKY